MSEDKYNEFKRELASLLNRYSLDKDCKVPDFVLATYITHHLDHIALLVEKVIKWNPGFIIENTEPTDDK